MKKFYILFSLLFTAISFSQSLVETVNLPSGTFWDYGYGMVYANSEYWISSGSSAGNGIFYAVDNTGNLIDTVNINYPSMQESQGLAYDGTDFWYIERKTARCDLFKVSQSGDVLDSIPITSIGGSWYLGGAAWDGTGLWISVYYPNNLAALYKVDVTAKQIVDTISVFGTQPTGITVKGDTLFYVMDGFDGDPENIYAVDLSTKDTLFSFHVPEVPGTRENPRGLAWDGNYFWLLAEPVGAGSGRQLFKYDLSGSGSPHIQLNNTAIVFPQTTVGDTSHTILNINNVGTAPLVLDSVTFSQTIFGSSATFPIQINPGNNYQLPVEFRPEDFTTYNATMSIYNNDITNPVVDVSLSGQGVLSGPVIVLSSYNHDFGNVWVGSDGVSYWSFNIINTGSQVLNISDMQFTLPEFSYDPQNFPIQVPPADTAQIRIIFQPDQAITYNDTLNIYSNDAQSPITKLSVQGSGFSGTYDLGYQFWAYQVPDNPHEGSFQEYRVLGLKPMNDITGDGVDEVVIATDNYWIMALNGAGSGTTDTLWTFNTYFSNVNAGTIGMSNDYGVQDALAIVSDLNGDGKNDVVFGTGGSNEHVYALDGTNGHIIWQYGDDVNYGLGDFEAVDGRRDFNGDGVPDILAIADGNDQGTGYHKAFLFDGTNGNIIWQYSYPGPFLSFGKTVISVADVTGDGIPDAIIAVGNNGTTDLTSYCLNGANGQQVWSFNMTNDEPKEMVELSIPGQTSDVIVAEYFGLIHRLDGETGSQVWSHDLGFAGVIQMTTIPDVNNDGVDDILIASFTGQFNCLSGATGDVLWTYPMNLQYGCAAVPDLNNDGYPDAITGDQDGTFYCMSGDGSEVLFSQSFPGDRIYTVNVMPSIDGNASYELLAGTLNGKVVCFSGGQMAVPVELTSFNSNVNGNSVILNWKTATQTNNKGFYVQRKPENRNFEELTFIKGEGTSTNEKSYSFTDQQVPNGNYIYRLKQVDFDGSVHYSNQLNVNMDVPLTFNLEQNYPNPFNPSTVIKYSITKYSHVRLVIYNLLGQEVATLINSEMKAGNYSVKWNGLDNHHMKVTSGIYIYRIESGNFVASKKMILLK